AQAASEASSVQRQLRPLGVLGVVDRPAEPLDELRRVVVAIEMYRVDVLVQQHWSGVLGRWIGRHDDSGHEISLIDLAVMFDPPFRDRHSRGSLTVGEKPPETVLTVAPVVPPRGGDTGRVANWPSRAGRGARGAESAAQATGHRGRPLKQVRPAGGADRTVCTVQEDVVRSDLNVAYMSIAISMKAT